MKQYSTRQLNQRYQLAAMRNVLLTHQRNVNMQSCPSHCVSSSLSKHAINVFAYISLARHNCMRVSAGCLSNDARVHICDVNIVQLCGS